METKQARAVMDSSTDNLNEDMLAAVITMGATVTTLEARAAQLQTTLGELHVA